MALNTNLDGADDSSPPGARTGQASLVQPICWAVFLFVLDALVFNQGVISAIVAFWLIVIKLPLSFLPRYKAVRGERLRNIGVYIVAAVLVFAFIGVSNDIARSRADSIVSAVHAFELKNGRYPKRLDELAPEFMPAIPRAKYTLTLGEFQYIKRETGAPSLLYVIVPPYYRAIYSFESNRWHYWD